MDQYTTRIGLLQDTERAAYKTTKFRFILVALSSSQNGAEPANPYIDRPWIGEQQYSASDVPKHTNRSERPILLTTRVPPLEAERRAARIAGLPDMRVPPPECQPNSTDWEVQMWGWVSAQPVTCSSRLLRCLI